MQPVVPVPLPAEGCSVVAVVTHWRGPDDRSAADDAPLLRALEGLLELPVQRLDIVVVTDQERAAAETIAGGLLEVVPGAAELAIRRWSPEAGGVRRITVERWRPRWPYRHGFYLTWAHKGILRRALRSGTFTHFLALEDDIGFRSQNLAYWLAARSELSRRGLIPGFVRFEKLDGGRRLVDQTRTGQHEPAGPPFALDGIGEVEVRRSRRPYQAFLLLDEPLMRWHLSVSPMRTPLRSAVSDWGVRERAAAGETFGDVAAPLRSAFAKELDGTPFSVRHAVLVRPEGGPDAVRHIPVEGALVEHLRPRYSADPTSRSGKVRVEDY